MRVWGWFLLLATGILLNGCTTLSTPPADTAGSLLANPELTQFRPTVWELAGEVPHAAQVVLTGRADWRQALEVKSWPRADQESWRLGLFQKLPEALAQGDMLTFRVWLRAPGGGRVAVFLEEVGEPWTKLAYEEVTLDAAWREVVLTAICPRAYDAGAFEAGFHLAYGEQTVQLTGARLTRQAP